MKNLLKAIADRDSIIHNVKMLKKIKDEDITPAVLRMMADRLEAADKAICKAAQELEK